MKTIPLVLALLANCTTFGAPKVSDPDPGRFSKAIANFQVEDAATKVVGNLTLFTGSSSIRMWTSMRDDFPNHKTLNRGFGGSHISDVLHYFDILVTPHKPKAIVLYCGENDLWSGKPPKQVFDDFKAFAKRVHEKFPKTRLFYICCKPSPKRWEKWGLYQECNRMIANQCAKDKRLTFVDVSKVMLGKEGKPHENIWLDDKLHLNAKGYEHWAKFLRPILAKEN